MGNYIMFTRVGPMYLYLHYFLTLPLLIEVRFRRYSMVTLISAYDDGVIKYIILNYHTNLHENEYTRTLFH